MNPEGLPFFINPSVLRTPPLYFALQNTGEEGNPLLIAVRYPAYGARQGEKVILDFVTATADIFLTPPSFGHLPYILRCKTQRRRVIVTLRSLQCDTPHTGHGKGGLWYKGLSFPAKVLVTLIHFICSFFSAARRTNQEAPPRLSGFWVCHYGRRRGLRDSLRSDSPRPFSSVFLVTSPPDKGGIGGSSLYSNPLALRALSLYFAV